MPATFPEDAALHEFEAFEQLDDVGSLDRRIEPRLHFLEQGVYGCFWSAPPPLDEEVEGELQNPVVFVEVPELLRVNETRHVSPDVLQGELFVPTRAIGDKVRSLGRVTEAGPIGASSVVTLQVHAAGTTQMANLVATPRAGFYDARPNVVLTCSSAGSEIRYSVVPLEAAPGTFSIYSGPISMPVNRTLYVYAADAVGGAAPSDVVRHDFRLAQYTEETY